MQDDPRIRPGIRVLLVEDEPLIALDAQDALRSFGVQEVVWARNTAEAEAAMGAGPFHAAILDFRVGSATSTSLAQRLTDLGIPFGFITGFQDSMLPVEFQGRPIVSKPFTRSQLGQLVASLVAPIAP